MIKLLRKIFNISQLIYEKIKKAYQRRFYSEIVSIIFSPYEKFEKLAMFNDDYWGSIELPAIFQISKPIKSTLLFKKQFLYIIRDAEVSYKSDIIITSQGAVWNKCYNESFPLVIPLDHDLFDYGKDWILYKKKKRKIFVKGVVVSMLGTHSSIWSHFLIQYLPKLYYAEECGLTSSKLTILVPSYSDSHIIAIIDSFKSKYPKVEFVEVKDGVGYICEMLVNIPECSYCGDHANVVHLCETFIPHSTFSILERYLVAPLISKVSRDIKYSKIYLVRRDTYRTISNYEMIEEFFVCKGFVLIEPHKLPFEEKVRIFYSADFVAGPVSAAFSNVIFCRKGIKALIMSNLPRSLDGYTAAFLNNVNSKSLRVTGKDLNTSIHSSFHIDLCRIEAAYNQLNDDDGE